MSKTLPDRSAELSPADLWSSMASMAGPNPPGPQHAAPSIMNFSGGINFNEGQAPKLLNLAGNATVQDPDSSNFDGGSLRLSVAVGGVASEDVLGIANRDGVAVSGTAVGSIVSVNGTTIGTIAAGGTGIGQDLVVALNAAANGSTVAALLRALTYSNSNQANPSQEVRSLSLTLSDGDGPEMGTATMLVSVIGEDDPGTLTPPSQARVSYVVDGAPAHVFADVALSDPDGAPYGVVNLSGGKFSLVGTRFTTRDSGVGDLTITDTTTGQDVGTFWSSGHSDARLYFASTANQATVNALINSVGVRWVRDGEAPASFLISMSYGNGFDPLPAVQRVTVIPDGPAPIVDLNGMGPFLSTLVQYVENGPAVALGEDIWVFDAHAGNTIDKMTVVLRGRNETDIFTHGALPAGVTLTASAEAYTLSWVFSGVATPDAYRDLLASIRYANSAESPIEAEGGGRNVDVWVESDGVSSEVAQLAIMLAAVDDPADVRDDVFTVDKFGVVNGNVLADNGNGADSDIDTPLYVDRLNGAPFPFDPVRLPSGAMLQLSGNGTFRYDPDPDHAFAGAATDSFTYRLQGGETATVTFHITDSGPGGNTPPTAAEKVVDVTEDVTYAFQVADFGFADADGDAFVSALLNIQGVAYGVGQFQFDADGADGAAPTPYQSGTWVSVADISAGKLTFVPTTDFFGPVAFTIRVRDDGGSAGGTDLDVSATKSFTLNYLHINIPPVVTTSLGETAYVDGEEVPIDLNLGLVDPDNGGDGAITSATIQITGNYHPGEDLLSVIGAVPSWYPVTAAFDAGTGTLTITGNGPISTENWRQIIANVRYTNTSDAPSTDPRTVTIKASDGIDVSAPATKTIIITAVNDAPIVDLDSATDGNNAIETYTERTPAMAIMPDALVSDADSANFAGGTLKLERLALTGSADDVLAIQNQGSAAGQIGVSGNTVTFGGAAIGTFTGGGADNMIVTFTAAANAEAAQALLRALTYYNPSLNPAVSGPTYTVTLSDDGGATSVPAYVGVAMNTIPDPTVFDMNGASAGLDARVTFQAGGTPILLAPSAALGDPDTANFWGHSLTVTLTNPAAFDNLTVVTGGRIGLEGDNVSFDGMFIGTLGNVDATTATVFLTSQFAPLEALQALVRSIGYVNNSATPATHDRVIQFTLSGGPFGGPTSVGTAVVSYQGGGAPPIAVADTASVAANGTARVAILDNDTDDDGGTITIATIGGVAAVVGTPITLASGARVTLNSDITLTYDPNGAFAVGAVDSFTYSLNGGSSATVSVTIAPALIGGLLSGTSRDDVVTGAAANESFNLSQGGADRINAGAGNDGIYFGAAFGAGDFADGGSGIDTLALQGIYSGLVLNGVTDVEVLFVASGSDTRFGDTAGNSYDYDVTTVDANVGAGGTLTVIGGELGASEDLVFNGGAETDGRFRVFAGRGVDSLTGGAGSDGFFFGSDSYAFGNNGTLTGADRVHGGAGIDTIALRGNYVGAQAVVFDNASFANIEVLTLLSGRTSEFGGFPDDRGFKYDVTLADGTIASGQRFDVIAGNLGYEEDARVDARSELDGSVRIITGWGNDILLGSAGNDVLSGSLGADVLDGGAGNDVYVYRFGDDSRSWAPDTITFGTGDQIDLALIDANLGTAANETFSFIGSDAFSNVAGQLRLFQSEGQWIVQGDNDGDGAADLVILVNSGAPLSVADFLL